MTELATLGLEVRSDGVTRASSDLSKLTAAAQGAEKASENLGKASATANQRVASGSKTYDRVAAQMEKLISIMERLESEQKQIAIHAAASAASLETLVSAGSKVHATLGNASAGATTFSKATKAVNDNVKLASHQLLNLSRQGNDVLTMLSLGASPMQVFASQAGQIYDALASGEGGLRGGLTAAKNSLKDFLAGFSRSSLIFGGVASAAIVTGVAILSFADKTEANFQKLEDAAKSYRKTIADLTRGHKELAEAADKVFSRDLTRSGEGSAASRLAELEAQRQAIIAARRQAPATALSALPSYDPGLILKDFGRRTRGETSAKDLIDLAQQFETGERSAESFRTELDKLGADAKLPKYLRDVLDDLRTLADGTREAEASIKSLNEAALQLKSDRFADFGKQLREFIPDTKTARDRINELADAQVQQAQSLGQGFQVEQDRQKALAELDRVEANRRAGYALDIRAISARTTEEKAAIAAERERLAVANDNISQADKDRRIEEARSLSLKQSAHDASEASRQRKESAADAVVQQQLELELIGKTVPEAEALQFKFQAVTEAKRAAKEAGTIVSQDELDFYEKAAERVGEFAEAIQQANLQRDLTFRLQQAGRSDQDQRIAEQLRGMGIEFDSAQGQVTANQLRYVESVEKTSQALRDMRDDAKDAFGQMLEGISAGEGAMSSFISAFAGFGRKLAAQGFDKLFGQLTGTAEPTGSSAGIGVVSGIGKVANSAARGGSDDVIRMPLAALNDNLQKSATSALAVAKQFDGLNERADSKVLDSFMQASGTWRNLSAADTAWCASFANAAIVQAGGKGTGSNLASSFLGLGKGTNAPQVGDIVVLKPQTKGASGHVGFVAGFGDGTVQVFGGNQSGGANTKSFGVDQVAGYRTGFGVDEMTKAVSDGNIMSAKAMAAGAVPGVDPWKGMRQATVQTSTGGAGGLSSLQGLLQSPAVKTGLAGLGAFASGMESGSPIGGALGGALSGFSVGGPIGAVVGGIAGLVGGIFGKSKAKKAAKKQKRDQARAAWDQNLPALHDLQDHINEVVRGSMSEDFLSIDENIAQFAKLAKDTKRKEDTATVSKLQKDAEGYKARTKELFRDTFAPVTEDLSKGLGLDSEFVKARDGVKKTAEAYRGFIGDVELAFENPAQGRYDQILATYEASKKSIESAAKDKSIEVYGDQGKFKGYETVKGIGATEAAKQLAEAAKKRDEALAEYQRLYGDVLLSREEAIRKATEAAREGLLRIVSGDVVEQTDVDKALDQSRGAAASLIVQLTKLGMTADEAGVAIEKALADRLKLLKKDFEANLTSQINDLDGVGYLNSTKDLVKEFTDLMADAGKIGADTSLVSKYFKLSAQDIVDGAELTGTAFADLIKAFPELTGVVTEFGAVVKSSVVQDGLKSFLSDRLAEATQKRVDAESELVSTFKESESQIKSFRENIANFLEQSKFDDASTLSQKDQVAEAARIFRETAAKANDMSLSAEDRSAAQDKLISVAGTYRDELREYFKTSAGFVEGQNEIESVLTATGVKAQAQVDLDREQVSKLVDINDTAKSIDEAIKALTDAVKAEKDLQDKVDGGRSFGLNPERNRLIDAGVKQLGLNFTGNYGLTNGVDQFRNWREALPADQLAAVISVIQQYIGINKQMGGLIPGFERGGMVGNGVWNRDSVLARYAGGGSIGLAGGEMVVRAPSVTPRTYPVLDEINRTGRLPGNDNGARLGQVEALLRTLIATTGGGLQRVAEVGSEGNRSAEQTALATRRARSNKQQAA